MREDLKLRWIDRVLSTPKDKQCKTVLSNGQGGNCIIGVLVEMGKEEGIVPTVAAQETEDSWVQDFYDWIGVERQYDNQGVLAPFSLPSLAGRPEIDRLIAERGTRFLPVDIKLWMANDSGIPWPVIADAMKQDL